MITTSWPHLEGKCEALEGWSNSLLCPAPETVARMAVRNQHPFTYFEDDPMLIRRTGLDANSSWSYVPYRGKLWKDPTHGWAIGVLTGEEEQTLA